MIASDENTVLAVDVVPGKANDAPRLKPLFQRTVARLQPTGPSSVMVIEPPPRAEGPAAEAVSASVGSAMPLPPRPVVEELFGDKAFGGAPQRKACTKLGVKLVSPPKKNTKDPIPFNEVAYQQRNRIERLFAKLKEFRRVATRHEKLKETFLGLLHLVLGFLRLRSINNVNSA